MGQLCHQIDMPPRTRSRRRAEEADPEYEDSDAENMKRRKIVESDSEVEESGDYLPADKTRKSVVQTLEQIFHKLVSKAAENGALPSDVDVAKYSRSLACEIEEAFYDVHASKRGDVGQRYRDRFRSLNFNLRNDKNESLQRQILTRELSPEECANLTSEQMLNPELRKLADEVRKESIRESVLKQETAPRVRRTHKGEEIVELEDNGINEDPEPLPIAVASGPEKPELGHLDRPIPSNLPDTVNSGQTSEFASFSPPASPSEKSDDGADWHPDPPVRPVWDGRIILGNRISCSGTAMYLSGPSDWASVLELQKPLEIIGKVKASEVYSYLDDSPRQIASLAVISDDSNSLKQLADYLQQRACVCALGNMKPPTRDAYLMIDAPNLGNEAKNTLDRLRKTNDVVLIAVFTVPKPH